MAWKDLNRNQQKAAIAFLKPGIKSVQDVAAESGLKVKTIIKYCEDQDFLTAIENVKTVSKGVISNAS